MLGSNPTDLGTVYPPTSDTYTTQPQKPRPPLLTQEASPRELRRAQSCEAVFAAGESANSQASQVPIAPENLLNPKKESI